LASADGEHGGDQILIVDILDEVALGARLRVPGY